MTTGYPRPTDDRSPEWRALTRSLADLAKRDSARFAAVVRDADRLQAAGLERLAAYSEALHNAEMPPSP